MATAITAPTAAPRTSHDEVAQLAHPKRSNKALFGMIASYVGMALIVLYCIIPF